jgi:hypothetical protein
VLEPNDIRAPKDISEIFLLEPPVPIISKRQKTKKLTITFMGKESFDALKTTLRLRQRGAPELTIRRYNRDENHLGIEPETLTLDSPLFRSYEKFFTRKNMKIKHLSPGAISVIVRKAAVSAGVWKIGFSAHALRRHFQTSLESAGVSANWVKKMMGHALGGEEAPYSRPEVAVLQDAYKRAYSQLAVSEIAEQKSRVEMLEAEVASLQMNGHGKTSEIEKIKAELEISTQREKTLADEVNELKKGLWSKRIKANEPVKDQIAPLLLELKKLKSQVAELQSKQKS